VPRTQKVRIGRLLARTPSGPSRTIGFVKGYGMVDVQQAGVREDLARIGTLPLARDYSAAFRIQGHRNQALSDENFLSGILAILVSVDPVAPIGPVVGVLQGYRS